MDEYATVRWRVCVQLPKGDGEGGGEGDEGNAEKEEEELTCCVGEGEPFCDVVGACVLLACLVPADGYAVDEENEDGAQRRWSYPPILRLPDFASVGFSDMVPVADPGSGLINSLCMRACNTAPKRRGSADLLVHEQIYEPPARYPIPEIMLFLDVRASEHGNAVQHESECEKDAVGGDTTRCQCSKSQQCGYQCDRGAEIEERDIIIRGSVAHYILC